MVEYLGEVLTLLKWMRLPCTPSQPTVSLGNSQVIDSDECSRRLNAKADARRRAAIAASTASSTIAGSTAARTGVKEEPDSAEVKTGVKAEPSATKESSNAAPVPSCSQVHPAPDLTITLALAHR